MAEHTTPVVELRDTDPDRPFLLIGQERYHYSLRSDLSLDELLHAHALGKKFMLLEAGDLESLSWMGRRKLSRDIRRGVHLVMYDMPRKVIRKLTENECASILEGFQLAQPENATKRPARSQTPSRASATPTRSRRKK